MYNTDNELLTEFDEVQYRARKIPRRFRPPPRDFAEEKRLAQIKSQANSQMDFLLGLCRRRGSSLAKKDWVEFLQKWTGRNFQEELAESNPAWDYYLNNLHLFDAAKRAERLAKIKNAEGELVRNPNEESLKALQKVRSIKPPEIEIRILEAVAELGIAELDFESDQGAIREFLRLQSVVKIGGELEQVEKERFRLEAEVQKSADDLKRRGVFHALEDGEHSVLFSQYNAAVALQRQLEKARSLYLKLKSWPIVSAIDTLDGNIYKCQRSLAGQPK